MKFIKLMNLELKKCTSLQKILFTDGNDSRAINAVKLHAKRNKIIPILLVNTTKDAQKYSFQTIIMDDWKTEEKKKILINKYLEVRKGKATAKEAAKIIYNNEHFGMLILALNYVDGVIGGLTCTSRFFISAAFRVIGPQKNIKTISSVMVMERKHEWYIFTDISININPNITELCHIAENASNFGKKIGFKSKAAFLSFSTSGSSEYESSLRIREATNKFNKEFQPEYKAIGEVQFDTAINKRVRKMKYTFKDFNSSKNPTIFVFPSLNAGNIGYKIAQRMGGFGAIGPIIIGLKKPVNDLSRAATMSDVYNAALLTALQTRYL